MKNAFLTLVSLACLVTAPLLSAAPSSDGSSAERFYGKITAVDHGQKSVIVHNKKQKADARFRWSDETKIISEKKAVAPSELKVGQSLMVSYITENDLNKAQRITIRRPFKKAAQ